MGLKAIVSDLHANLIGWRAVRDDIRQHGIADEDIVILGDILGYGPNPKEVLDDLVAHRYTVFPGNHDNKWVETAEAALKGMPLGTTTAGMKDPAYAAIRWQIREVLTENPQDYFADDWIAKQGSKGVEFPGGMIKDMENVLRVAGVKAVATVIQGLRNFSYWVARKEAPAIGGIRPGTMQKLLNVFVEHAPEFYDLNRNQLEPIAEHSRAKARLEYMRGLVQSPAARIIDGMYCAHGSMFGGDPDAYVLDPLQRKMGDHMGLKADESCVFIDKVVEAVQRMPKKPKKIVIARGHTHRPSLYTDTINGIEITMLDPGGLMPRIKDYEGTVYFDKGCWFEKEGDRIEMHSVGYKWESVDKEMEEKKLPRNSIWMNERRAA